MGVLDIDSYALNAFDDVFLFFQINRKIKKDWRKFVSYSQTFVIGIRFNVFFIFMLFSTLLLKNLRLKITLCSVMK